MHARETGITLRLEPERLEAWVCLMVLDKRIKDVIDELRQRHLDQFVRQDSLKKHAQIFAELLDRKSTRLNSSHDQISYAVFCLKKKKKTDCALSRRRTRCSDATPAFPYDTADAVQLPTIIMASGRLLHVSSAKASGHDYTLAHH